MSEQARHRAVSVAAEASLKRAQVQALLQQQQQQQEEQDAAPPDLPHPPLLLSSEILTPTPVAPPISQNSPTMGDARGKGSAVMTQQASSSNGEGGSSSSLIEDDKKPAATSDHVTNEAVFKSLGNWSIKEFEGDVMDPFEITSLQAINDMEELQSVLLPTKPQQTAVAVPPISAKTTPTAGSHLPQLPTTLSTAHVVQSPVPLSSAGAISVLSVAHPTTSTSISSPELATTISSAPQQIPPAPSGRSLSGDKFPHTGIASPLTQSLDPAQDVLSLQVSTNPFISNIPAITSSRTMNPFLSSEPVVIAANHSPPAPGPAPQHPQARQDPTPGNPEVGTLVDLGGGSGTGHTHIIPPIPAPRTSPKVRCSTVCVWDPGVCGWGGGGFTR